jgi:hypothetical protein
MVMADQPLLTQSEGQLVWRFGAFVTSLSHTPRGPIGHVDVDATTGEILADERAVEGMKQLGTSLQWPAERPSSSLTPLSLLHPLITVGALVAQFLDLLLGKVPEGAARQLLSCHPPYKGSAAALTDGGES